MTHWTHNLDPVLLSFGSLQIRWYGLMYLVGFSVGLFFLKKRHEKGYFRANFDEAQVLISYLMIGMIICARLVYVLVYNPSYYWQNPGEAIAIWRGGLSFHGALIGFGLAILVFSRNHKMGFWHLSDNVTMGAAQGIFWGRMGNFINGELYGRPTDVSWGIIFPGGGSLPRHPSQLYQGLLEGLGMFVILLAIDYMERKRGYLKVEEGKKKKRFTWLRSGVVASCFLIGYGIMRFIVEFFREPDSQLGYFFGWMTMGQILCLIMMLIGSAFLAYVLRNPKQETYELIRD
ncbi:MAG: prolipoprotein diacylglyceryl transferase [Bdellovibrionales bacterium]|nr:prolipoprotein diacylglyceryl transferase [Bdellovibrionales bacterium]